MINAINVSNNSDFLEVLHTIEEHTTGSHSFDIIFCSDHSNKLIEVEQF